MLLAGMPVRQESQCHADADLLRMPPFPTPIQGPSTLDLSGDCLHVLLSSALRLCRPPAAQTRFSGHPDLLPPFDEVGLVCLRFWFSSLNRPSEVRMLLPSPPAVCLPIFVPLLMPNPRNPVRSTPAISPPDKTHAPGELREGQ